MAGMVIEVGAGVTGFAKGDKVSWTASVLAVASGAFAQYAVTQAETLARIPQRLSMTEARAFLSPR